MSQVAHPLRGAKVVLAVSGGIAAYKAVELVRLLTTAEASVQVVMTRSAQQFVGPLTFQTLTGHPVFTDLFSLTQESEIGHIQAADRADLMIVAPATANTIAGLAAGLATDPVGAIVLASRAPLLVAPSMNVNMWTAAVTQDNVRRLVEQTGARLVGPDDGFLACKWTGSGRLAQPEQILHAAARVLSPQDLAGRTIVVSAGPTREQVDPVRFLSNRSTGKMGFALARAAAQRGAHVVLVSGPVDLPDPDGVQVTRVVDAAAMLSEVTRAIAGADAVIMAAAVADFRPSNSMPQKLKKDQVGSGAPSIPLSPTEDILATLGRKRAESGSARPVLIGFAAETDQVIEYARRKLDSKQCDLIVANDVSRTDAGFASDNNQVTLVQRDGEVELPLASKDEIAHGILDWLRTALSTA